MWTANSPIDWYPGMVCDNCRLDISDWWWNSDFLVPSANDQFLGKQQNRKIVLCKLCIMSLWADISGPFYKLFAGAPEPLREALADLHRIQVKRMAEEAANHNPEVVDALMKAAYPPEAARVT